MSSTIDSLKTVLIGAFAPVLWGTMPIVATQTIAPGHPLLVATVRSLGGGLLLLALLRELPSRAWYARVLILGLINIAAVFALFFISASRIPGGVLAIIMALSPFWAASFAWPLLGQRPMLADVALIGLGVLGVALIVGASDAPMNPMGVLAALGASACMGLGVVLIKRWGRPSGLLAFASWQLTAGGIILCVLTLVFERQPLPLDAGSVAGLGYLMLLATVAAYPAWFVGIERLGAQRTSLLLLLVPVVAILLGAIVLKQGLTGLQFLGMVVVLVCLALSQRHLFLRRWRTVS